ncbi:MAG: hypothetical protein CMO74_13830 [Verrucomicrobiales bacterium]|nr:hypothetical protein [Verrucomicrobiales bacterium]
MTMNEIRYYYHKQIKKLKEEAEMKSENIPLNNEQDYLKYIATQNKLMPKSERSSIKDGDLLMDMEHQKVLVRDLNAVLEVATLSFERQERLFKAHPETYDGNKIKALQESINNIQEYKEKLNNQYTEEDSINKID